MTTFINPGGQKPVRCPEGCVTCQHLALVGVVRVLDGPIAQLTYIQQSGVHTVLDAQLPSQIYLIQYWHCSLVLWYHGHSFQREMETHIVGKFWLYGEHWSHMTDRLQSSHGSQDYNPSMIFPHRSDCNLPHMCDIWMEIWLMSHKTNMVAADG